jgi:hypothetical protein
MMEDDMIVPHSQTPPTSILPSSSVEVPQVIEIKDADSVEVI